LWVFFAAAHLPSRLKSKVYREDIRDRTD